MLYRKAYERLREWKNQSPRKALCITGARQIGKTTLIRQFGKESYSYFVEINFIEDPDAGKIFDGKLDADTIITNLTAFTRKRMKPGDTLVLLDEIQECPNARTAIKFLVEDGRFDYIESGSLLGVKHKEVLSYPVGYETIYRMYPMDFEEFILANGVQKSTINYLKECFNSNTAVSDSVHEIMIKLFYGYIVVGGMPQVVQTYVDTHDIGQVLNNQNDILELYRLDIPKYAKGNDKIKIRAIFDSIPSQLNQKNRRFFLNSIDENARKNRYSDSFRWLDVAGVALPCLNVTEPRIPLRLNEKNSIFKLFMNDTGLLCAASMGNIQFELLKGNLGINMGSVLENVIAQQIKCNGFKLNYFAAKKYGEIDIIIQNGMNVDMIEVKSGKDYMKHRSLDKVLAVDEWKIKKAYVLCASNIIKTERISYLPWYACMFLKSFEAPQDQKYMIDTDGLENLHG